MSCGLRSQLQSHTNCRRALTAKVLVEQQTYHRHQPHHPSFSGPPPGTRHHWPAKPCRLCKAEPQIIFSTPARLNERRRCRLQPTPPPFECATASRTTPGYRHPPYQHGAPKPARKARQADADPPAVHRRKHCSSILRYQPATGRHPRQPHSLMGGLCQRP